jgi:hypothetical protein
MIDFEPTETQNMIVETAREFGREMMQPAERKLDLIARRPTIAISSGT